MTGLALAYTALRWSEAWGLWFDRRWAEWLGVVSGAVYLPIEVYEIWEKPGAIKATTLTLNLGLVAYLVWTLRQRRSGPAAS